ncbi:uncharacterized protein [Henckelia pumila]|uniref:uncharacterized protein n=1 Tax=Henckelia pumila TaxID=405737 RepID=UPI003C6E4ACD
MTNHYAFETVSQTFKDIMDKKLSFGGNTIIFGGDFRQVLPVVKRGSMRYQIAASISSDGLEDTVSDHVNDANYMVDRAIITTKNLDVDEINEMLNLKFPGEEKVYTSWDSVEDDNNNIFQEEFLNSLCPSGLLPHRITLKVGCPIMLLRNVAPELGLCNETRLICRNFGRNFIDTKIIIGPHKGDHLKILMQFNADAARDIQAVQMDAITRYQQNILRLNAQLHMPTRMQIIGLGWKITIGMKINDFGQRHSTKKTDRRNNIVQKKN